MFRSLAVTVFVAAAGAAAAQGMGARRDGPPPPGGGYGQTCRDIDWRYGELKANCQTRDGSYRFSSVRPDGCPQVENIDGRLTCVGGPPPGAGPVPGPGPMAGPGYGPDVDQPGRPMAPVILYEDDDYTGRKVRIWDDTPDLAEMNFANLASSIHLRPGERWEVCQHKFYTGRCIVVGPRDVAHLRDLGFNDQASSLRRAR